MILNTPDFNLEATLESGQVFGFQKQEDWYEGFISSSFVRLKQANPNRLAVESETVSESEISHFFHLDYDLEPVYRLLGEDPRLHRAAEAFKGLRIIRQNLWEALSCFIISSNNNIKRIQKIRSSLSLRFSGNVFRFPNFRQIAESSDAELRLLGLGYRAPYLLQTAKMIVVNPGLLGQIQNRSYSEAKNQLLEFPGVGEKVADCVLLFGIQKYEAFPVDTWVSKVMQKLYFRNRKTAERKIQNFGQKRWKEYAGYIQQYLFHGAKSGIL